MVHQAPQKDSEIGVDGTFRKSLSEGWFYRHLHGLHIWKLTLHTGTSGRTKQNKWAGDFLASAWSRDTVRSHSLAKHMWVSQSLGVKNVYRLPSHPDSDPFPLLWALLSFSSVCPSWLLLNLCFSGVLFSTIFQIASLISFTRSHCQLSPACYHLSISLMLLPF